MGSRTITEAGWAVAVAVLAVGCGTGSKNSVVIGEAYVGPESLQLRSDIPLDSPVVATVKHGQKLDIVGRRRRFYMLRASNGAEGWTHERNLLAAGEMSELDDLSERAAKLPSQGLGATYNELNVHTQPAVSAPSFLRLKSGEKFQVVAEILAPRTEVDREPLIPATPKKQPVARKPKKEPKVPPPPIPAPPGPPGNWLELSKTILETPPTPPEPPKPAPTDWWSLIRTSSGQCGWVLTRFIYMAIPDEVAQYAEGHRIVSYFPLAQVEDGDQKKTIWLWTTVAGRQPYDFDAFRVFIWSLKRRRYETAYIARGVRGYWPVLVNQVDYAIGKGAAEKYPGFSVCIEKDDGKKYRREYALLGNIVRLAGESSCQLPPPVWGAKTAAPEEVATTPVQEAQGFAQKLKERLMGLFHKASKRAAH